MRKIFFSLFLILFPTLLFSQYRRDFEQEIDLGISGGVDFSKVSFLHNMQNRMNQLGNQSFTPNYRFGVVCRYISQYHFGLQIETNYVKAGWEESFIDESGSWYVLDSEINKMVDIAGLLVSRDISYIEVPLLAHIYFGKRKVRFFVNMGPFVNFIIDYGQLNLSGVDEDLQKLVLKDDDPRLSDDYRSVGYGITGGLGMNFIFGKMHFLLEGRFMYGFSDLYSNNKSDVFQRSNNQLFNVTASVMLPVVKFKGD
jgi:hypothetical protein